MAYKRIHRRTQRDLTQTEGATSEVSQAPEVAEIQTDRDLMTADDALALQDTLGNRATGQIMGAASPPRPPLQAISNLSLFHNSRNAIKRVRLMSQHIAVLSSPKNQRPLEFNVKWGSRPAIWKGL